MADNAGVEAWTGDAEADAYLVELVAAARRELGGAFVGAYLVNSGARQDYLPGRSDLDVEVIVHAALDADTKHRVADALRHRSLPCPAPRLELVVYRREVVANPSPQPAFEVNLNTGPAIADHVTFEPADEPPHWFVLDLAAAADAAVRLAGPDPRSIFGPVPRHIVLDALRASNAWHATNDTTAPNRILNLCRAWCFVATGRWTSKSEAAAWAIDHGGDEALIRSALARRSGTSDEPLAADAAARFASAVERAAEGAQ